MAHSLALCQDAERNGCGAGDFHALVLLSLGQQRGGQQCRERAEPTGANQAGGDWTLNSGILLVTGHFYQSRNLPKAVERSFQVKGQETAEPDSRSSVGEIGEDEILSNPWSSEGKDTLQGIDLFESLMGKKVKVLGLR